MPEVFGHDVLTCLFCNEPVEDERFRCEVIVRPELQPALPLRGHPGTLAQLLSVSLGSLGGGPCS
jgi:hypothetical protein